MGAANASPARPTTALTEATALTRNGVSAVTPASTSICRVDRMPEPPHHGARSSARGAIVTGLSHRQSEILNIARAFGRVMVEDLARRFEVSAQTIRKDLNDLCDHRSLTRIHGGAIIASGVENLAYEARRFVAADEKKAIGAAAAALIPNGCSLFINIGTTTEEVASALTSHEDLLVITNNLNVAMLLYRHPRIEVIVAGGAVRSRSTTPSSAPPRSTRRGRCWISTIARCRRRRPSSPTRAA
jgi:hypothetical protein